MLLRRYPCYAAFAGLHLELVPFLHALIKASPECELVLLDTFNVALGQQRIYSLCYFLFKGVLGCSKHPVILFL